MFLATLTPFRTVLWRAIHLALQIVASVPLAFLAKSIVIVIKRYFVKSQGPNSTTNFKMLWPHCD